MDELNKMALSYALATKEKSDALTRRAKMMDDGEISVEMAKTHAQLMDSDVKQLRALIEFMKVTASLNKGA